MSLKFVDWDHIYDRAFTCVSIFVFGLAAVLVAIVFYAGRVVRCIKRGVWDLECMMDGDKPEKNDDGL